MWARTLWPLDSSTLNMAFGRASTTVPSISMTPSFFGIASALLRLLLTVPPASDDQPVRTPLSHDRTSRGAQQNRPQWAERRFYAKTGVRRQTGRRTATPA